MKWLQLTLVLAAFALVSCGESSSPAPTSAAAQPSPARFRAVTRMQINPAEYIFTDPAISAAEITYLNFAHLAKRPTMKDFKVEFDKDDPRAPAVPPLDKLNEIVTYSVSVSSSVRHPQQDHDTAVVETLRFKIFSFSADVTFEDFKLSRNSLGGPSNDYIGYEFFNINFTGLLVKVNPRLYICTEGLKADKIKEFIKKIEAKTNKLPGDLDQLFQRAGPADYITAVFGDHDGSMPEQLKGVSSILTLSFDDSIFYLYAGKPKTPADSKAIADAVNKQVGPVPQFGFPGLTCEPDGDFVTGTCTISGADASKFYANFIQKRIYNAMFLR